MLTEQDASNHSSRGSAGLVGGKPGISVEMVNRQVNLILAHPQFQHSKRSCSLLRFIVRHSLMEDYESLRERNIAIEVFGKEAGFDTALDSTVRVAATEVRRRLMLYYSDPGREQELRIDLPTRSYVAEFNLSHAAAPEAVPEQQPVDTLQPAQEDRPSADQHNLRVWVYRCAAALLVAAVIWGGYLWFQTPSALDRFWSPLLKSSGPILISVSSLSAEPLSGQVPGTYSDFVQKQFSFSEIAIHQVLITTKRDESSAIALASFLGLHGKASTFQIAQSTTLEQMKGQPAVIVGGIGNEWTVRLSQSIRFQFRRDLNTDLIWVQDASNPAGRNWSFHQSDSYINDRKEYALVTRALDATTGQWWIGAGGLTGLGTLVAQQMITDSGFMAALDKQLPKHWDKKNLQVVLEIDIVKESPGSPQVVATYLW